MIVVSAPTRDRAEGACDYAGLKHWDVMIVPFGAMANSWRAEKIIVDWCGEKEDSRTRSWIDDVLRCRLLPGGELVEYRKCPH